MIKTVLASVTGNYSDRTVLDAAVAAAYLGDLGGLTRA